VFYDVTAGDMDVNCTGSHNCYRPSGENGVLSTSDSSDKPAFPPPPAGTFATGIGTLNAYNLVFSKTGRSTYLSFLRCMSGHPRRNRLGGLHVFVEPVFPSPKHVQHAFAPCIRCASSGSSTKRTVAPSPFSHRKSVRSGSQRSRIVVASLVDSRIGVLNLCRYENGLISL